MSSPKTLFLFTAGYPYGTRDEPFLENEIDFLAESFEHIVIFPVSKKSDHIRKLPRSVAVDDTLIETPLENKKSALLRHPFFVLKILFSSISIDKVVSFWKNRRFLLDYIAMSILRGESLKKKLKKENTSNVVFYDYWFANSIFSIALFRKTKKIRKFICRAHRYDIYEDNWPTKHVPFFNFRIREVDELYFISEHGLSYIESNTPAKHKRKLKLSLLGVIKPEQIEPSKNQIDNQITIVSCARVVDFKRVHLIPKVLEHLSQPIKWIHFGDGPLFDELKQNIETLPNNVEVDLKGHIPNEKVLSFYQNHKVNLFLSISSSEGLPVSMMEALSYGIPIVAVNAGGINEIVLPGLGLLIDKNSSLIQIATGIEDYIKKGHAEKEDILKLFDQNFNAEKNYRSFAQFLIN